MTDKRDDIKIDINDPSEVEYVHQQFPHVTHAQVEKPLKKKAPTGRKCSST